MNRLVEYILSEAFERKVNAVMGMVLPILAAVMVARILEFIVEFILYPANFH